MAGNQQELMLHELPEDALTADIAALKGAHIVGKKLRPDLEKEAARNWVLNCLNPNHSQNFKLSQVRMICNMAREVGSTHYVRFMNTDNAMTEPQMIEPEDERAKLQREFIKAQSDLSKLLERMEKIK